MTGTGLTAGRSTRSGGQVNPPRCASSRSPEGGQGGDRVWFQGAALSRLHSRGQPSIVSGAGGDGSARRVSPWRGSARLGPEGCSSSSRRSSRLRGSGTPAGSGRRGRDGVQGRGTAAELGLRSVSSRRAAIPLEVRWVQVRIPPLLIFLFYGRRAEAAGRKEGGREENARGMLGNEVSWQKER